MRAGTTHKDLRKRAHSLSEWHYKKEEKITNAGEDAEKVEPLYTVAGNVNPVTPPGKTARDYSIH